MVMSEQRGRLLFAEVSFEQTRFGFGEVDDDQAIQGVGEIGVDIEAEEFPSQA